MFGDLPPSSVVEGIRLPAAYSMIRRPVVDSPVKATLLMRLLEASAIPTSAPGPLTMLMTPAGTMPSMTSANLRIDQGVGLAGFRTATLPPARAGASFQAAIRIGKLNGMIS